GAPLDAEGRQQGLVVLGMGKLGGGELNFSSDIDLIFAYPEGGRTTGGYGIADFFARLARGLIKVLGERTADGHVFRVDVGLRPYGDAAGPMAMSFDAMEEYYQLQGREWERYALIKARVSAESGETVRGDELLQRLKPFVYRRYLDFGVFESLRDMKRMISREVKRKGMGNNIKLGPGGIREIEFFGQMFQLIRGGVTPVLQTRGIMKVLSALEREKTIEPEVRAGMERAYRFLRRTENHVQMVSDMQTHALPADPFEKLRLAASMGFDGEGGAGVEAFERRLRDHMGFVHAHFDGLLSAGDADDPGEEGEAGDHDLDSVWLDQVDEQRAREILAHAGFEDPGAVRNMLGVLRDDPATRALSAEGRNRLDRLIPRVMDHTAASKHSDATLDRILDLIRAIERRTSYLSLLLENPPALVHLVRLGEASTWITSFLSRHPVLLDELLDPRELYEPPQKAGMEKELAHRLQKTEPDDLELQIEELCIFKQVSVLRVAAADVTGALALMRVSDYLTDIAITV
ncbi:MAG: bifunctional [glutamate--ammonia ligase]-adenylyl-L-tyrosine phosphorylase/[glutamate--ammonia-ligase] adenylyltransferase, partial [Desulfobacterales bacterium]|nr:bifunctional [glutamate--ammonia ligase]-adenylyl-L-tyrosine phosphorylase/[glutamate--ammonia-ligase] adenylyltransferase [Desulfobacterales bacterium]